MHRSPIHADELSAETPRGLIPQASCKTSLRLARRAMERPELVGLHVAARPCSLVARQPPRRG